MKTIARTVLLGLLIGATVPSMCQAGDPVSMSASASGTATVPGAAPVIPTSSDASPFTPEPPPMPGLLPAPSTSGGQSPTAPPSAGQSGRVQLVDSPAGTPTPGTPANNQAPGSVAYDSMGGQATASDSHIFDNTDPFGPRFYLNGYFGDAPGWTGPSYQADLYYPWHVVPGRSVFLGALQASVDDYGKGYFNMGVGYREYFPDQQRILGAWGWLDWDDTNNAGWLRFGGTLESLGKYLEVRANWYVLADQGPATVSQGFTGAPFFQGYNILLNQRTATEDAFDGFDLEFGGHLPFLGRYGVSGYVGPYYLHSDSTGGAWGVEGRINVAVTDNCQVNVDIQHDNQFDTTAFVNVSLMLPDGVPTKWFKPQSVYDMLGSMVIRRDRVPVTEQVSNEGIPFLNPPGTTPGNPTNTKGDLPIDVIHVDPNLPAGTGNGTAESPFGSLEQARLANNARIDIIDIQPRTDGSGTNLTTAGVFSLFNYQHVWGSTIAHTIDTTAGVITVGPQNPGLPLPLVSNGVNTANSTVFSLASVDEISGLHISGANSSGTAFGNGIANLGGPIVDFNINQNQFTNYQNAVFLQNAFGDGSSLHLSSNMITGNTATGTANVSQNGFEIIDTLAGTTNVTIKGNTSTANAGDGYLVETANTGAVINATFTNNAASQNGGTGIHVAATGGVVNVDSFTDSTVTNNPGNGVWIDVNSGAGGGTINVQNFQGNTITGNATAAAGPVGGAPDGLLISAQGTNAQINAAIGVLNGSQNIISNNGAAGVGGAGVHLYVNDNGIINGSIVNNIINNNVSFGINVDAVSGNIGSIGASPTMAGAVPFVINGNTLSGNGDAGIFARLQNSSEVGLQIINNSVLNTTNGPNALAAGEGIHLRTEQTSFLWDADIENNFVGIGSNGSAGANISNGIEIESFTNSRLFDTVLYPGLSLVKIINNLIEFNGGDGINFQRNGDSVVNDVLIQGNTSRFNVANGVDLIINGGAIDISNGGNPLAINFTIISNNLSNNGINGAVLSSTADADLRVLLGGTATTGNLIENNGQDGVNASTLYFSQVEGTWSYNTINNNGRDGIRLTDGDETGPSFNVTIANNTIQGNLADGIFYTSVETIPLGGGNGTVNLIANLIEKNGNNGVNVEPTGSAVANINLTDNQIIANSLNGVRMQADEFGVITTNSSGNTITNNGGDGWSLTTQTGTDSNLNSGNGTIDALLTDNMISFNAGHGINILNQWSGTINVDIEGTVNPTLPGNIANPALDSNIIDANGLDGILITNDVDPSLSQQRPLLTPFNISFLPGNNINVTVNQTEISGNGTKAIVPDDGDGILINVGTSEAGAVTASLTNNHFSGNANIDVVTQSFVATAQPLVEPLFLSTGQINIAYEPDPVARLNFTLTGNVGDTIDVTRSGAFYGGQAPVAPDQIKSITGTFNDPSVAGGTYTFAQDDIPAPDTRRRNAQRATVVNQLSSAGTWPEATLASQTNPNDVAAATTSTTSFSAAIAFIGTANDYQNALVTFTTGLDTGQTRVITSTTTAQVITVGSAFTFAPAPGDKFYITAPEQSGVGVPTFVTNSGPSVLTHNEFTTVVSDFTTQVGFTPGPQFIDEAPFTYTWSFTSAFPGITSPPAGGPASTAHGPPQLTFPQSGYPYFPFP
jgi:Inverse autotransporter, beta-domain